MTALDWLVRAISLKFDPILHVDVSNDDKIIHSDGSVLVVVRKHECRMKFGTKLAFDPSGENNFTRGIKPFKLCQIIFDDNQQPKIHFPRNHPRIVQAPYSFHLFVQIMTCNLYS